MEFSHTLIGSAALKSAIDHEPLLVSPQAPLLEVIAQMSQAQGKACGLWHDDLKANHIESLKGVSPSVESGQSVATKSPHHGSMSTPSRQASCVLVVDQDTTTIGLNEQRVIGIFTERDIVKLVAKGKSLEDLTIGDAMVSPVISLSESEFKDIFAPLFLFRRYRIRHLLIVDDCDRPIGIVSPESIRTVLRPANLLKLRRVADIMARDVICADYQSSVLKTAQLMTDHRVSCVVITEHDADRGALPIGIVTERDIVQFRTLELDLSIQVGTVMSSPLSLLNPDDSLWTAHQEMQRLRVRRLVVSWNWGKGLGIVTQTSLLRVFDPLEMYGVLETLQTTIEQLQAEKRLSSTFAASPTLNIDSKAQLSLVPESATPSSLALPGLPDERVSLPPASDHLVHGTEQNNAKLDAMPNDVYNCIAQLSQRLKMMEATLAELSCIDGDRPKKTTLLTELTQAHKAIQHLEQLLQPTLEMGVQ